MVRFKVVGMSCAHCVRAVTEAAHAVDDAAKVDVDLQNGEVRVESAVAGATDRIAKAITAAGYEATPMAAAA